MPIPQSRILAHEPRVFIKESAEASIKTAKSLRKQTAFLSHSHKDEKLAKSMQSFLKSQGWDVYIDWEDEMMPSTTNRITAERIQAKIKDLDWFLFLATDNSMKSRWCPWEIGYADGVKSYNDILIIPTEENNIYYGNEYLQLYRHIDYKAGELKAITPLEKCATVTERAAYNAIGIKASLLTPTR